MSKVWIEVMTALLLLLSLFRFDLESVIPSSVTVHNAFVNDLIYSDVLFATKSEPKLESGVTKDGLCFREGFCPSYLDRFALASNQEPVIVAFNPIKPKNPVRVPVNNGGVVVAPASLLQNVTASSSAFNARAEALGDLFMDETYLQSNLDLDEITAVAGHVTKEDLDVQRLVDVLWSQEVDLGVNREWLEHSLRPPAPPQPALQPLQSPSKEPQLTKAMPAPKDSPFLLPSFYQATQFPDGSAFVDSETGEVVGRLGSSSGNDSRDPGSGPGLYNVSQPVQQNLGLATENRTRAEEDQRLNDRHLQSLIEALNSLNSSTMQAVQNQTATGSVLEERWEDVQSLVAQQPNSPDSLPGMGSSYQMNSTGPAFMTSSSIPYPNNQPANINLNRTFSSGSGNGSLSSFDFFSMFMDPPSNYSLPQALATPPTPKANLSEFLTFPSGPGFNGSTVTRITPTTSAGQQVQPRSNRDLYGNVASNSNLVRHLVSHEGPLDLAAFPYSLADLQQQVPMLEEQPQQGSYGGGAGMYGWNMTADWINNSGGQRTTSPTAPSMASNIPTSMMTDLSDFAVPSQSGNDYLPAVNSSGNILSQSNNMGMNGSLEWNNSGSNNRENATEMLMLLDEAKQRLDKQQMVPEIKQEEMELDPWTERATMIAASNHTYARTKHEMSRKREGSFEDGEADSSSGSTSGSTGLRSSRSGSQDQGSSGARSTLIRHSRDDRAASEQRLPVSAEDIVNMPVEEFNNYVAGQGAGASLTPEQIQLMKDIRRRGKNKVAAQNCRRRKIDNMGHLEKEIMNLRQELESATQHRDQLARQREHLHSALGGGPIQSVQLASLARPVSVITSNPRHTRPQPPPHPSSSSSHMGVANTKRNERDVSAESQRKRKRDH